jgi:hypothetical protein
VAAALAMAATVVALAATEVIGSCIISTVSATVLLLLPECITHSRLQKKKWPHWRRQRLVMMMEEEEEEEGEGQTPTATAE